MPTRCTVIVLVHEQSTEKLDVVEGLIFIKVLCDLIETTVSYLFSGTCYILSKIIYVVQDSLQETTSF